MRFNLSKACLLLATFLCAAPAWSDQQIAIIRHGEKPAQGLGQLNCQGLNRALALPSIMLPRFGKPVALYAPNPAIEKNDKGTNYPYIRPLATIEPLAVQVALPVNIQSSMTEIEPLAKRLLTQTSGVQIVAWEHHWGEDLAKLLLKKFGADENQVPKWADDDFDSIYLVQISEKNGKQVAQFKHDQQGLNNLPASCITVK